MKPIIWLDCETTGTSVSKDRVIELAMVKTSHACVTVLDEKSVRINPGIPVPQAAIDVHGITDEMLKDCPPFKAYAKAVAEFCEGCDLGTFNGNNFDLPLLAEEFARCGISWPEKGTAFVDACQIFHRKEERTVSAAVKFYCGHDHEGAHSGLADVKGTIEVYREQLSRYADLSGMSTEEIAKFCRPQETIDLAGKIYIDEHGIARYNFGKDRDKSVKDNPGFAQWMLKQDFTTDTKNCLKRILGYMR